MWEKIKANSAYIYLGVIVIGYLSYALYTYGFEEFIIGHFKSMEDYRTHDGDIFVFYNMFFPGIIFLAFILISHLYIKESKYAKLSEQIFAVMFVILLIYLRKNL